MRELKRRTPDTISSDLDRRVAALERRFFNTGHAWAVTQLTTDQTIGANSSEILNWDTFWTNAPETFDTLPNGATGDTTIRLDGNVYGVIMATCSVEWQDPGTAYAHSCQIAEISAQGYNLAAYGAAAATASEDLFPLAGTNAPLDTGDVTLSIREWWDHLPTTTSRWQVSVNNLDSSDRDVLRAFLCVVLLPNGQREQDYVVY